MATIKDIEYKLGRTNYKNYPQLTCDEETGALVRGLVITPFGDDVGFGKKIDEKSRFSASWGVNDLACFRELQNYNRLLDIATEGIEKLAIRMYELLYLDSNHPDRYTTIPVIDTALPLYCQIREELRVLQGKERELVENGKIKWI